MQTSMKVLVLWKKLRKVLHYLPLSSRDSVGMGESDDCWLTFLAHRIPINSHEMYMVVTEVMLLSFSSVDSEGEKLMREGGLFRSISFISQSPFSLYSSLSLVCSRQSNTIPTTLQDELWDWRDSMMRDCSGFIKERMYIGEAIIATCFGIAFSYVRTRLYQRRWSRLITLCARQCLRSWYLCSSNLGRR